MIRSAVALAGFLALAPPLALAEDWPLGDVAAPSGLPLTLDDVIYEENPWSGELLVVVRLIAPMLDDDAATASILREDMDWACETWGVPAAESLASPPDFVVVEMMAEPVERGTTAPEIRQVFEQYSLAGPVCIWELF